MSARKEEDASGHVSRLIPMAYLLPFFPLESAGDRKEEWKESW